MLVRSEERIMCGIAGIIYQGSELKPHDTAEAERMTRALSRPARDCSSGR